MATNRMRAVHQTMRSLGAPGMLAAALILAVGAAAAAGLWREAGAISLWDELQNPHTRAVIRFTVWQAALSTALSVLGAIPFARALARRRFCGRRALLALGGLAFVTPTMAAVLGIAAVHGRAGWVNQTLSHLGLDGVNYVYGLGGILIAHTFFNLPLAARIFAGGLATIPQRHWELALLHGLRPRDIFRSIEWPLLRGLLPPVAGFIFLLCFTSFAVVLNLGGGPRATTMEVAIYQALRFDFDLNKAAALALLQIILCIPLTLLLFAGARGFPLRPGDATGRHRPDAKLIRTRITDATVLSVVALFLLSPLAAVFGKTFVAHGWLILTTTDFWHSLGWTAAIAAGAGLLATLFALALCDSIIRIARRRAGRAAHAPELLGVLTLLIPPIALGAGLFLFFRRVTDALSLAPAAVIMLNAFFTIAFAMRIILPALQAQREKYHRLCASLGVRGWWRWKLLWPALRPAVGYALAVTCALSAGDMGVIALFGTDELSTLPLLIHRLLGAYRLEEAAVTAATLMLLCGFLFWSMERGARRRTAISPVK